MSDRLAAAVTRLGVDNRYSVLANLTDVLAKGADPEVRETALALTARAVRRCGDRADRDPASIGLVIAVTSSPGRLMPNLVCDLFAALPWIPRRAMSLGLTYMGCSVQAKAIDTAGWFLSVHPQSSVLVCFTESHTPLMPPLKPWTAHFTEGGHPQDVTDVINAFLFGDAAVAMLLTADGNGPTFGPVTHLTNELPDDAELGTIPEGGSDVPVINGRRTNARSANVPARGLHYAKTTVNELLARPDYQISAPNQAESLLMHTGSARILDGLCAEFDVPTDSPKVAESYRVLREYGNTSGCSVPLMIDSPAGLPSGENLVVAFGISFAAGATTLRVP
ncbi:3-oxoacyl-ACP synthase [Kibdelosporangium philippinense]|uniref:3-oxoacyl-ACP synthase n=2 Tax=Kibdelosporangium philippinense TaxID=211113 RepID=A0ABS8Z9C4_9PSEU|nr:3-oxoacyl-ACP synthase [Kibdelosporangium philippinense]MCE7004476.1 3-oxoacyl-ACP synthase [Kibdelosporangium philippinense]